MEGIYRAGLCGVPAGFSLREAHHVLKGFACSLGLNGLYLKYVHCKHVP